MNELYVTAKRNSRLPSNIKANQYAVFPEFSDPWNFNLAYPVLPKPWIPIAISKVCKEYNLNMLYP